MADHQQGSNFINTPSNQKFSEISIKREKPSELDQLVPEQDTPFSTNSKSQESSEYPLIIIKKEDITDELDPLGQESHVATPSKPLESGEHRLRPIKQEVEDETYEVKRENDYNFLLASEGDGEEEEEELLFQHNSAKDLCRRITLEDSNPSPPGNHVGVDDAKKKSRFKCEKCNKEFESSICLTNHLKIHENNKGEKDKIYVCGICQRRFAYVESMLRHMGIHRQDQEKPHFECEYCHKRFAWNDNLKRHVANVHLHKEGNPNPHFDFCDICQKSFVSRHKLRLHVMRTHKGMSPYTCEVCKKEFVDNSHLKRHVEIHDEERKRPYVCEKCGKAFTRSEHLDQHFLTHQKERPFACKMCKKKYKTAWVLKQHKRTHSGQKGYSYECKVCAWRFPSSMKLRDHTLRGCDPNYTPAQQGLLTPAEGGSMSTRRSMRTRSMRNP